MSVLDMIVSDLDMTVSHPDRIVSDLDMTMSDHDMLMSDTDMIKAAATGPDGSLSCQNRVPMETRRNPTWPDGTRRALTDHSTVPYQCTVDIRTYIRDHTGP